MMKLFSNVYDYTINDTKSFCYLDIIQNDAKQIVTCTELPENPGKNSTECTEFLFNRIYKEFCLNNVIWIEAKYNMWPKYTLCNFIYDNNKFSLINKEPFKHEKFIELIKE